jgi:type VI secretion system secreted protein Hcp
MRAISLFFVIFLGFNLSFNAQVIKKVTPIKADNTSVSAKIQNPKYFVRITGITGESKDSKHQGWIELDGIDFQMMKDFSKGQQSGVGTKSLRLFKNVDSSSGAIAEFFVYNSLLPKVELEIMQTIKNMQFVSIKFDMTNAYVSNYQLNNDSESNNLMETFSLEARTISATYFYYDSEGKLISTKQFQIGDSMY